MEKNKYTNPLTEVLLIETRYALCDNPASSKAGQDPNPPEAPKRRVF